MTKLFQSQSCRPQCRSLSRHFVSFRLRLNNSLELRISFNRHATAGRWTSRRPRTRSFGARRPRQARSLSAVTFSARSLLPAGARNERGRTAAHLNSTGIQRAERAATLPALSRCMQGEGTFSFPSRKRAATARNLGTGNGEKTFLPRFRLAPLGLSAGGRAARPARTPATP